MIRHWWQSTFLLLALFALAACSGADSDAESTSVEVPSTTPSLPTSSPEPSTTPFPTATASLTPAPRLSPTTTPSPEPSLTPAPSPTPETNFSVPSEVSNLLAGTDYVVVSEGTVLQEGGQAKAFLDSSGTPVVIENLSNGHLERVAFNVLGTEVRILPNQEVLHIRPMEEAESVVKGNNLKIEDTSTAYPPFTDVWGSANISPIAVYEVSMESWDIVQPDEDAYTFSVARASFAYSWNGVIYHGQAFLRKSIPFGSSLNRSVNTINSEEYGGIRSIGLEFLQKETEIQNYEAMVLSTNLGQYFDPIAISAWGVMSTGSIENLEAALSAGQALLGNPNSSFIPTGISNAR